MLPEISLNVLDISENSTRAGATLVSILVKVSHQEDVLTVVIKDDGCGMTPEQAAHVTDPFFTTRTTRKVGLGVPFFKLAAESTGGRFDIHSEPGKGTTVTAVFGLSHIDRMPLGDITGTISTLILFNQDIRFRYVYQYDGKSFVLDTNDLREILGDIPFDNPEVAGYITSYLEENKQETDGGVLL